MPDELPAPPSPRPAGRLLRLAIGTAVVGLAMLLVSLLLLVAEGIAFRAGGARLALALDFTVNLLLGLGAMVGVLSLPLFLLARLRER